MNFYRYNERVLLSPGKSWLRWFEDMPSKEKEVIWGVAINNIRLFCISDAQNGGNIMRQNKLVETCCWMFWYLTYFKTLWL